MTIAISSPITGAAQTGFTAPTYTVVSDSAPDVNAKQYAVTALGGTQTGVTSHSIASPFTMTFWRPKILRLLGIPNPTTGILRDVPSNVFALVTRKGVTPLAGQAIRMMQIETKVTVPAGADTADAANIRAALSAHIGGISQISAGFGDTAVTGVV
jgi:hypothetical protein